MQATDPQGARPKSIVSFRNGAHALVEDLVACEEPLEIKLATGPAGNREHRSLAVTMRTPGQDAELAIGFLFTEGIIGKAADVSDCRHVGQALAPEAAENILLVELSPGTAVDFGLLNRHFYTSSSCGVCGKASIEMVRTVSLHYPRRAYPVFPAAVLQGFPDQLLGRQSLFAATGGIHAAGAFTPEGQLLAVREDVGRHNAMDKLIGSQLQAGRFPMRDVGVMVSGRLSFELVQKAATAGVPLLAAVGAPSSLAVELAEEHGITLVGFLRGTRFNVYCGEERIQW